MTTAFHTAMKDTMTTANGAASYHKVDPIGTYEGRISWFFKGIRGLNPVYGLNYLKTAAGEDLVDTICLIFNTRDILEGKGERDLGRKAFQWLMINYPDSFENIIHLIPEYGRWDDLYTLFPKYLNLENMEWVNNNYCSNIDAATFAKVKNVQQKVVEFYKTSLDNDYKKMKNGDPVSLAAKWAETEGSGDDRKYRLVETMCKAWNLHPKGYRVRIVELRSYLNVVEKKCCGKQWNEIDYSKVPAVAMKKLKKAFAKNDPQRFAEFLQKLQKKDPTVKVNAKTLHPHELVAEYIGNSYWTATNFANRKPDPIIEEQWKVLEQKIKENGALEKTIVVSDVSGSMYSKYSESNVSPLIVCVALSLFIAKTSKQPWNNSVISFSEQPQWHDVTGTTLLESCEKLCECQAGLNTNFESVFRLILQKYDAYKLTKDDLPEQCIVISDMQFDQAGPYGGKTNLQAIDKMFADRGLRRPRLIFWNVNSGLDFPATTNHKDVAMIGGFSPSILKGLTMTKEFTPACVMRDVIDNDRYMKIKEALSGWDSVAIDGSSG